MAELETLRQTLHEQCRRWEAQSHQSESQLAARNDDLDGRHADISLDAPVSSQEIFRRLGIAPVADEPETQTPTSTSPPWPVGSTGPVEPSPDTVQAKAAAKTDQGGEEEESVEQYMARLLQRVRNMKAAATVVSAHNPADGAVSAPASNGVMSIVEPTLPPPALTTAKRRRPAELPPGGPAPEKNIDLSAMRELANLSAQTALDCHTRRRLKNAARSRLLVAVLALIAAGSLLYGWWGGATTPGALYSGAVCLLIAIVWGIRFAVLARRLITCRRRNSAVAPEERQAAAETAEDAKQADDPILESESDRETE